MKPGNILVDMNDALTEVNDIKILHHGEEVPDLDLNLPEIIDYMPPELLKHIRDIQESITHSVSKSFKF